MLTEETYNQMNSNLMKDNMEQPCGEFQIVEFAAMQGIFDKYKIGGPAQRKLCMMPETQRKAVLSTIMASKIENPSSFIVKAVTKSAEAERWVNKQWRQAGWRTWDEQDWYYKDWSSSTSSSRAPRASYKL